MREKKKRVLNTAVPVSSAELCGGGNQLEAESLGYYKFSSLDFSSQNSFWKSYLTSSLKTLALFKKISLIQFGLTIAQEEFQVDLRSTSRPPAGKLSFYFWDQGRLK